MVSWLVQLTTHIERPIATHVEGNTTFLSPPGRSNERLYGWAAVHADTFEQVFGKAVTVYSPERYIEKGTD